jgi:hypothetical protein
MGPPINTRSPRRPALTSVAACPGVSPPSWDSFPFIFSISVLRLETFHSRFLVVDD